MSRNILIPNYISAASNSQTEETLAFLRGGHKKDIFKKTLGIKVLFSLAVMLFLFFYTYTKVNIYISAYQIENSRQKLMRLQEEKSRLDFAFRSRLNLEKFARNINSSDFTFEKKIVKLPANLPKEKSSGRKAQAFFARIFNFTQQAEAKP